MNKRFPGSAPRLVHLAVLATCASGAWAQTPDPAPQRIEITGSNIRRIDAETAAPVQVIGRTEIKESGANTVRQIVDTITATSSYELRDNGNTASFAAGATGVSMRGLGKGATLVLMNGRRIANFGLADGGQYTFVNIDAIPADAVERVEVLKDGASAIYGSDAMAGVINIITRSSYQGLGASASYQQGITPIKGATQTTVGLIGGFGNIDSDRYNVFANVEFYKRSGYMLSDVRDSYPTWHKDIYSPAFGDPSLVSSPGNYFRGATRVGALPSCPTSQRNAAGACTSDLNGVNQYSDPAQRVNLFAAGRVRFTDSLEGFAEISLSDTKTSYLALPYGINAPATPFRWYDGYAKQVRVVNKPLLAVGSPQNPQSTPAGLEYRFMDPNLDWSGPATSTQYGVNVGLKGLLADGKWDWEATLGRVGGKAKKDSLAPYAETFIPAVESGQYVLGGTNSDTLLQSMFRSSALNGDNSQTYLSARVRGDLFDLPAGPVQVAFGAELRREELKIKSVDDVMNAKLIGRGGIWVEGTRNLQALYGEAEAPIIKGLTANIAARYDKAPGYAGRLSPKFGLRFQATDQLLLRGTIADGFRAPNIPETMGRVGLTGFFNGTYDPKRCDTATAIRDVLRTGTANDRQDATTAYNSGCSASVPAMISSNPTLKPELSRSFTAGFVFQPVRDVSIAMDYFKIERRDEISFRDPSYVLDREDQAAYAGMVTRLPISTQDTAWASRAKQLSPTGTNLDWTAGQLLTLLLQYENFGKTEVSGIDLDVNGRFKFGDATTVRWGGTATYMLTSRQWDIDANEYRPNQVGLNPNFGSMAQPRLQAIARVAFDQGPWTFGMRFNYVSRLELNGDETDVGTWGEAGCRRRLNPGAQPCYKPEDLTASFNVKYSGIRNLTLGAVVDNVFASERPVDLRSGYSPRPMTLKLAMEYKFF